MNVSDKQSRQIYRQNYHSIHIFDLHSIASANQTANSSAVKVLIV